jgi:glutamate-ammonia-ligase adenylyltransferase
LRLAQRIVHYVTTTTIEGYLYRLDTRLRPHGNDGMLACSLSSFVHYQRDEAWTWEHQALVRARVVAGDESLSSRFTKERAKLLLDERNVTELRQAVSEMRERMRSQLGSKDTDSFDIKQDRGGMTDIEFIVQFATLRWAKQLGPSIRFTDNIRLLESLQRAGVLRSDDARVLDSAYKAYRERNHQLSLQEDPGVVASDSFSDLRVQVADIWHRVVENGLESQKP